MYFFATQAQFQLGILNITFNGTAHFKNVNNCWNTNIYSYLDTSGGQNSNLELNVVNFFNTSVNHRPILNR